MIEPREAWRRVQEHCPPPRTTRVALGDAGARVLAEDLAALAPFPAFDNSAMDGYALRSNDTSRASKRDAVVLALDAPVYAGDTSRRSLAAGHACAVMTGAPMPRGADTVVPVEVAEVSGARLCVRAPVARGRHVRRGGEEVRRGATVLRAGTRLHAGAVAVAASAGREAVRVYRTARVCIVATGSETVGPGARLQHGQIYDSNTPMLAALVRENGFEAARVRRVKDQPAALRRAVEAALRAGEVVVVAGGVSVGERDYARSVFDTCGVREVFWRVSQKPGKPLYFGTAGRRLVFGLPGNPASVFTCFHLYVLPALRRMAGFAEAGPRAERRRLAGAVSRDPVRWRFLKARLLADGGVEALPAQASHMVTSLAVTDALIAVAPGTGSVRAGARVDVYRLEGTP